jgi:hypothetical protein
MKKNVSDAASTRHCSLQWTLLMHSTKANCTATKEYRWVVLAFRRSAVSCQT